MKNLWDLDCWTKGAMCGCQFRLWGFVMSIFHNCLTLSRLKYSTIIMKRIGRSTNNENNCWLQAYMAQELRFQPFTSQNTAWFSNPWKSSRRRKGVRCHSDLSRFELATSKLGTSHLILWATTASGALLPSFILKYPLSTRTSVSHYLPPSKNT